MSKLRKGSFTYMMDWGDEIEDIITLCVRLSRNLERTFVITDGMMEVVIPRLQSSYNQTVIACKQWHAQEDKMEDKNV